MEILDIFCENLQYFNSILVNYSECNFYVFVCFFKIFILQYFVYNLA